MKESFFVFVFKLEDTEMAYQEVLLRKPIQNKAEAPFLNWIKAGRKTYEGRLFEKCKDWDLKVGKRMIFYDEAKPDDFVTVEITILMPFADFGLAYDMLGKRLIPDRSREEVVKLYNGLFHDPDEDLETLLARENCPSKMIARIGVVAIGFKVVK